MSAPYAVAPRIELRVAAIWVALGALIVFLSWRMDRLEQQGATLHSAPGLWPGMVGLALALLGGVLLWRSISRARTFGWDTAATSEAVELVPARRFRLAVAMFFVYALLLVGRGLPFWLGTALFVTAFVFVFRRADRLAAGEPARNRRDAVLAVTCGLITAIVVTLLFEKLFYVRLP